MKGMNGLIISIFFTLILAPAGVFAQTDPNSHFFSDFVDDREVSFDAVNSIVSDQGSARVIVRINVPILESDSDIPIQDQMEAINDAQDQIFQEFISKDITLDDTTYAFVYVPYIVLNVDPSTLDILRDSARVSSIFPDISYPPLLKDSTKVIGADVVWDPNNPGQGFTGKNQVIAILDTGVDKNHPFLAGKVIDEECFSTQSSDATSLCPNGTNQQSGSGAALNCNVSGCDHGTHVAGIAAGGTYVSGPVTYHGVAKEAKIIAVQVFSKFSNPSSCNGLAQCVRSYTSDQMKGLEKILDLKNTYNVSSVNLSLGGGSFSSACDSDPRKSIIDQLRAVGVATVIASGNDGNPNGIGAPACISSAISVGSTKNNDVVSSFSNSADILDLLAPGDDIRSSVPGGGLAFKGGTSMATPHVAGAWALMKEKAPNASVQEILDTLKSTGVDITDSRNGKTFKRIQLDKAVPSIPEFQIAMIILAAGIIPAVVLIQKNKKMQTSKPNIA